MTRISKKQSDIEKVKLEVLYYPSLAKKGRKNTETHTSSMWSGLTKNCGADGRLTIYRHRG